MKLRIGYKPSWLPTEQLRPPVASESCKGTIFISIASYRDPQLVPTIRDCLGKARFPDQLRFGICWQHGGEEQIFPFQGDPRFRILEVDWRESRGVCWARALIMRQLYSMEDFFLQLDSHHRFVQDWDIKLKQHAQNTGCRKPLLTTYGTPFTPGQREVLDPQPMQMNFDRFSEDGIVSVRPGFIPRWRTLTRPIRARFVSAHFLFTIGEFVKEVPYDSDLYFFGEETMLAIRTYSHGYDLFHPPEVIVWHEYTRAYRRKHWDDHVKSEDVEIEWHERDATSRRKIRQFLEHPCVGPLGLGTVRTLREYETYAGLSFRFRKAQEYTLWSEEPPNPPCPDDWAEKIRKWEMQIKIDRTLLPAAAIIDPFFWYVGFHDANRDEIYRCDVSEEDFAGLLFENGRHIIIERRFEASREPKTWTLWPYSRSKGWLAKIEGVVGEDGGGAVGKTKINSQSPRIDGNGPPDSV